MPKTFQHTMNEFPLCYSFAYFESVSSKKSFHIQTTIRWVAEHNTSEGKEKCRNLLAFVKIFVFQRVFRFAFLGFCVAEAISLPIKNCKKINFLACH